MQRMSEPICKACCDSCVQVSTRFAIGRMATKATRVNLDRCVFSGKGDLQDEPEGDAVWMLKDCASRLWMARLRVQGMVSKISVSQLA